MKEFSSGELWKYKQLPDASSDPSPLKITVMSVFYLIYLHNNNIGTLALIVVVSHVSIYLMSLSIKSNIYYSVKITSWCFVLQWSATIFANLRSSLPSNPTENVYNCLGYIFL